MKRYKILEIQGLSREGREVAVIVKANPIVETLSDGHVSQSFNCCEYRDTVYFLIPKDSNMIQDIVDIAQSGLWTPLMSDYVLDYINRKDAPRQLVFCHKKLKSQ